MNAYVDGIEYVHVILTRSQFACIADQCQYAWDAAYTRYKSRIDEMVKEAESPSLPYGFLYACSVTVLLTSPPENVVVLANLIWQPIDSMLTAQRGDHSVGIMQKLLRPGERYVTFLVVLHRCANQWKYIIVFVRHRIPLGVLSTTERCIHEMPPNDVTGTLEAIRREFRLDLLPADNPNCDATLLTWQWLTLMFIENIVHVIQQQPLVNHIFHTVHTSNHETVGNAHCKVFARLLPYKHAVQTEQHLELKFVVMAASPKTPKGMELHLRPFIEPNPERSFDGDNVTHVNAVCCHVDIDTDLMRQPCNYEHSPLHTDASMTNGPVFNDGTLVGFVCPACGRHCQCSVCLNCGGPIFNDSTTGTAVVFTRWKTGN